MRTRSVLSAALGGVVVLAMAGVPAASASQVAAATRTHLVNPRTGLPLGETPTTAQRQRVSASHVTPQVSSSPHLDYFGGPVVSNARIVSVLWGAGSVSHPYLSWVDGSSGPNASTWAAGVGGSAYINWLSEYNTPSSGGTNQHIGYGSFVSRTTITPATATGTLVFDPDIQTDLFAQINAHTLPAPALDAAGNVNTVYALYFPKDVVIDDGRGNRSGVVFCAYHSTTAAVMGGRHLLYMILPDPTSTGMSSGCGVGTATQNLESYTSHELVETITDPEVGVATSFAPPLGWYDTQTGDGEIGDICNGAHSTVTGTDGLTYTVQTEWSNNHAACIAQQASSAPAAPTATATAHPGGHVSVTWTPPANDGGTSITGYKVYRSTTPGGPYDPPVAVGGTTLALDDTSGTPGTPYYYVVRAGNVVGDGAASAEVHATPDTTAPTVHVTTPPVLSASTALALHYSATDPDSPTGLTYDVRYRKAAWNGSFGVYTTLHTATTAVATTLTGHAGFEYCFDVRSRDVAGNYSPWSADRCTVVALDDRSLAVAAGSWARIKAASSFGGTLSRASAKGAQLRLVGAKTDRLGLLVETCTTCGTVAVYVNGTLWRSVNTHASATHVKVFVALPTFSLRTATILIKVTSSGKPVNIDGLAVGRT